MLRAVWCWSPVPPARAVDHFAGMVNHCNDNRPDHIITIEDPIEFVHESKRCW